MIRKRLGRLVSWQHTREIGCHSSSPYWDWVEKHSSEDAEEHNESMRANPDMVSEAEKNPRMRLSVGDLSTKLSGQQKKVFARYIEQGRSIDEIAEMMDISRGAVYVYLRRIGDKLKTYL